MMVSTIKLKAAPMPTHCEVTLQEHGLPFYYEFRLESTVTNAQEILKRGDTANDG